MQPSTKDFCRPCATDFTRSEDILVKAFKVEQEFHYKIIHEFDPEKRKTLYRDVYNTVHSLYGRAKLPAKQNPKINLAKKFGKAFHQKSILDVGCGRGWLSETSPVLSTRRG